MADSETMFKLFSKSLIGLGILQTLILVSLWLFFPENLMEIGISYVGRIVLPVLIFSSLLPIAVGAIVSSRPEKGWYVGMVWSLIGIFSSPIGIIYILILALGWLGKDARTDLSNIKNVESQQGTIVNEEAGQNENIDIEEVFSESLNQIEDAQEIEDKAKRVAKEQELLEEFGEKAGKAGISEEKLETYSDAITSEASHIKKETLLNKVKTTQASAGLKRDKDSSPGSQKNQGGEKQEESKSKYNGRTKKNALIGVIVSSMLYFIPGVNAGAPFIGGFVAGTLQRQGMTGGIKVGIVQAIFMTLPAFILAVLAAPLIAQIPIIGGMLATAGPFVIAIVILSHTLFLGTLGGFFGGLRRRIWDAMFG